MTRSRRRVLNAKRVAVLAAGPFTVAVAIARLNQHPALSALFETAMLVLTGAVIMSLIPAYVLSLARYHRGRQTADDRAAFATVRGLGGVLSACSTSPVARLVTLIRQWSDILLEVLALAPVPMPALSLVLVGSTCPPGTAREARPRSRPRLLAPPSRGKHAHGCPPRTREGVISA